MCGIAGAINYQTLDLEALKRSLHHRGPDEQAIYTHKNIALIHTRLSIVDLQNAHQPMHHQSFTIIFNGEIYNHQELRKTHLSGAEFTTTSDTETLLLLYAKYKEESLGLLDGMFAFCVYDKNDNSLFLARDRAGKKPLYYIKNQDTFLFASEINSIKRVLKLEASDENLAQYIRCGFFYRYQTAYKHLYALENGCYLKIECSSLDGSKKSYFEIERFYTKQKDRISLIDALSMTEELLLKSVKDRLLSSDLEVGAFLSGGIDSSLVVALASQIRSGIKTFTVSFKGAYNEAPLALLTAQKYGTHHTEIEIEPDIKNDIEKILSNYGEPFFDSSCIPSYYVSAEAKKHLTVILNGDGADELFGGYRRYVPFAGNLYRASKLLSPLSKMMPKPNEKKSLYNYIFRLLELSAKSEPLQLYLSSTTDIWEGNEDNIKLGGLDGIQGFIKSIFELDISMLSKMMLLDFELLLFGDLLVKMDIATMAHSLEGRSPFLSKYMLEFAPCLPDNYKIKGVSTKYILRELAKKHLPKELISQPKRGFEVPLKEWVEGLLKDNIYDLLTPREAYSRNFIDSNFLDTLLQNKSKVSREKRAKMLWTLFALEVWQKGESTSLQKTPKQNQ